MILYVLNAFFQGFEELQSQDKRWWDGMGIKLFWGEFGIFGAFFGAIF